MGTAVSTHTISRVPPPPICSLFINDDEPGLLQDYQRWLEKLAPFNAGADPRSGGYLHNRTGEDSPLSMGDLHTLCV